MSDLTSSILIIDDDAAICKILAKIIKRLNLQVVACGSIKDGLAELNANEHDIVLLDVDLPDGNGLGIISQIKEKPFKPEVIIMTGYGDADGAEIAIKGGVWDYLPKSDSPQNIVLTLQRAIQYRKSNQHRHNLAKPVQLDGIIGRSSPILACYDTALQAAASNANVLIVGETGTGKELFARAIHYGGKRSDRNFVVVDCASLPQNLAESILFGHVKGAFTGAERNRKGLVAETQGGTLFLDEIGELPLSLQKVFLRVIQEHRYRPVGGDREESCDFRLISATNRNLDDMVNKRTFRDDLLYRLRSILIQLPPLRLRKNDLHALVLYFLDKKAAEDNYEKKGISPEFFETLNCYHWPGNVRELFHVLESAIAAAQRHDVLYPVHLPKHIRTSAIKISMDDQSHGDEKHDDMERQNPLPSTPEAFPPLKAYLLQLEKNYLETLLIKTDRDTGEACRISGLSRSRFYDRLKKFSLLTKK